MFLREESLLPLRISKFFWVNMFIMLEKENEREKEFRISKIYYPQDFLNV